MSARWTALAAGALLLASDVSAQERFDHGRFEDVAVTHPAGELRGVVLLLSGGRADPRQTAVARALATHGSLVVAVDVPAFFARLEASPSDCEFADGDLENLSHFAQGFAELSSYYRPWLVGIGPGAALAYAMLAQAPTGTFAGALSAGFQPQLALAKPLCPDNGLRTSLGAGSHTLALLPAKQLSAPWVVLESAAAEGGDETRSFVAATGGAALVSLPAEDSADADASAHLRPLLAAYDKLVAAVPAAEPPPPSSLADLPLIEVPAKGTGATFVVFVSGDGGWAGLDETLAAEFSARGMPVVGLDSLRYFWKARTPARVGADIDRLIRYYAARWRRPHALLVGYSQGADVLPFAVNRLSPTAHRIVSDVVLLSPGTTASFEFHLKSWIGAKASGLAVLPEATKLDPRRTVCIYGKSDETLCPLISPAHARAFATRGGHHFDGDYPALAELILAHVNSR
jgi:type IV secretory pathway VirJ component